MTSIIMTVLSTTPRLSTSTPRTTTSTMNTEIVESTKNVDVITEKYLQKNIKGSHHFERYSENSTTEDDTITSSVTIPKKENSSTMKEIINYTETTEQDIDVITLSNDIIDNDTTTTLPNESIVSEATLKYNVTIDIIENNASSKSDEPTTDRYSFDVYYSTDESKVDNTTDSILTSSQSNEELYENLYKELYQGFKEYTTENFTNKYERLEAAIVSNITIPSLLTDPENNTSTEYFSDSYNYFEKSQPNVTTNNIIISTSPTQSDPEEDENITYSTPYLNYKESTTNIEYNPALINENLTRYNSSATTTYTPARDERSSATTKVGNVI